MADHTTSAALPPAEPEALDITRFLNGRTQARGFFEDRFGRVRREFSAVLNGTWEGAIFVLREDFQYSDGVNEQRVWRITPGDGGHFTATCADCIGVATGHGSAGSWHMRYKFRLKMKQRSLIVAFDDRVHRITADMAINKATVRKWGIRLGEVVLVFERLAHQNIAARPNALGQAEAAE
jgi:Protein of unknown function (DUF3833)